MTKKLEELEVELSRAKARANMMAVASSMAMASAMASPMTMASPRACSMVMARAEADAETRAKALNAIDNLVNKIKELKGKDNG